MTHTGIRPPVHAMALHLYRRGLHPELYETRAERIVSRDDYTLTVRLTTTGHVLMWQAGDLCLTEVTAPYGHTLPKRGHVWHHRFEGEARDAFRASAGIIYQMNAQRETLPPDTFYVVHQELLNDSLKRGVAHLFTAPDTYSDGLAPFGLITADARQGCLVINTFHTFPADCTILKTQTIIERISD